MIFIWYLIQVITRRHTKHTRMYGCTWSHSDLIHTHVHRFWVVECEFVWLLVFQFSYDTGVNGTRYDTGVNGTRYDTGVNRTRYDTGVNRTRYDTGVNLTRYDHVQLSVSMTCGECHIRNLKWCMYIYIICWHFMDYTRNTIYKK